MPWIRRCDGKDCNTEMPVPENKNTLIIPMLPPDWLKFKIDIWKGTRQHIGASEIVLCTICIEKLNFIDYIEGTPPIEIDMVGEFLDWLVERIRDRMEP